MPGRLLRRQGRGGTLLRPRGGMVPGGAALTPPAPPFCFPTNTRAPPDAAVDRRGRAPAQRPAGTARQSAAETAFTAKLPLEAQGLPGNRGSGEGHGPGASPRGGCREEASGREPRAAAAAAAAWRRDGDRLGTGTGGTPGQHADVSRATNHTWRAGRVETPRAGDTSAGPRPSWPMVTPGFMAPLAAPAPLCTGERPRQTPLAGLAWRSGGCPGQRVPTVSTGSAGGKHWVLS